MLKLTHRMLRTDFYLQVTFVSKAQVYLLKRMHVWLDVGSSVQATATAFAEKPVPPNSGRSNPPCEQMQARPGI